MSKAISSQNRPLPLPRFSAGPDRTQTRQCPKWVGFGPA